MINYSRALIVLSTVLLVICTTLFILRLFHQRRRHTKVLKDDIVICIAFLLLCLEYGFTVQAVIVGFGAPLQRDAHLSAEDTKSLAIALSYGFAAGNAQLFITRLSIAITCYNFSHVSETLQYRLLAKFVLYLQCLLLVLTVPPMIPCVPISALWTHPGLQYCQDFKALVFSLSGISLADDFLLVIAPFPILLEISGSSTRFRHLRSALWFLFFLGLVVITSDCVQLIFSRGYMFSQASNPTDAYEKKLQASLWFIFRNDIVFVVACLPQARATISHAWHNYLSTSAENQEAVHDTEKRLPHKRKEELDKFFSSFTNGDRRQLSIASENSSRTASSFQVNQPTTENVKSSSTTPVYLPAQDLNRDHGLPAWLSSFPRIADDAEHGLTDESRQDLTLLRQRVQVKEWEQIYPSEDVQIKDFCEQFEVIDTIPFSTSSVKQASKVRVLDGRSTLQKQYFDQVMAARREQHLPIDKAHRGMLSRDMRHQSGTLPAEDLSHSVQTD